MGIEVIQEGALRRVRISGEMTIYTAADLKQSVLDAVASGGTAEIDLGQVTEFDTAGLQLLVLAKNVASHTGAEMLLVGHSPPVIDVIDIYGLAGFFGDPLIITASRKP